MQFFVSWYLEQIWNETDFTQVFVRGKCVLSMLYFLLQEFLDSTQKLYQADMQAVDFIGSSEESRKLINHWVEEKTEGKSQIHLET